ncbi:hypothetical protein CPHO_07285 [Corynebacterium phocae]|uniref:Uncharacterized protein n=1 Tax=Corynebacterium phocae TaxID=161895 RepID=A0A1L7D3I3_9CORY|nr:hypothetical protein [Corynebacterium phocae]APT92726.1 hypothetical protein CPHO_07285 [Corynebacterium phocae]KAA8723034.1 hypothetical protein F4V58_06790 [Corynebacterium phocae]
MSVHEALEFNQELDRKKADRSWLGRLALAAASAVFAATALLVPQRWYVAMLIGLTLAILGATLVRFVWAPAKLRPASRQSPRAKQAGLNWKLGMAIGVTVFGVQVPGWIRDVSYPVAWYVVVGVAACYFALGYWLWGAYRAAANGE